MAADDIYRVTMHFENPTGHSSSSLYYQETVARSGAGTDVQVLGRSFTTVMRDLIRQCLGSDWEFPATITEKITGSKEAKFREDHTAATGLASGTSLPANNALLFGLQQGLFPPRSNGKLYLPGVPEGQTTVGNINGGFVTSAMLPLAAAIAAALPEESAGTGVYVAGVISAKVRDLALPAKDWMGAFAPIIAVSTNTIVATQKRRQTRVLGQAL